MAANEELLKRLEEQRVAYLEILRQVKDSLEPTSGSPIFTDLPDLPNIDAGRKSFSVHTDPRGKRTSYPFPSTIADESTLSDESDEELDDYFVQQPLPSQSFDHEHLRNHIKTYSWDRFGRQILSTLITDRGRLKQPYLFPNTDGPAEDRSHYSHYDVFDVGTDGAPLLVETAGTESGKSKASQIWHSIKNLNAASKTTKAVGRITIAREPAPILFAALHLTMNSHFPMDEIFRCLVESDGSHASMFRSFDEDPRKQRSFIFNFEYYTIIGEDCKPMSWQLSDRHTKSSDSHIPLTRCSAVVALSLHGTPIRRVRNPARRAKTKHGYVYDTFAPWQVLNIQCYPDWRATVDGHDSTKHYVNGPEAFLATLLTEYRDAQKRFEEIYQRITKLITPGLDFLFNEELREVRLFEDKDFTWTRRYFWAHQTLGAMNDSIKAMIDMFEDTFTEEVWEGNHKTLWPLLDEELPRNAFWKKRMRTYRHAFEKEIRELRVVIDENNARRHEIKSLRDQLYSGTSVLESRKSVELGEITILQGHNIKLLTLVNMLFLPMMFVTSVFGMTNMPTEQHYWAFGITLATVTIPFFLLIGSLNSTSGMKWWGDRWRTVEVLCKRAFRRKKKRSELSLVEDKDPNEVMRTRSTSTLEGMALRLGRPPGMIVLDRQPSNEPNVNEQAKIDAKRGIIASKSKKEETKIEEGSTKASTMSIDPPSRVVDL